MAEAERKLVVPRECQTVGHDPEMPPSPLHDQYVKALSERYTMSVSPPQLNKDQRYHVVDTIAEDGTRLRAGFLRGANGSEELRSLVNMKTGQMENMKGAQRVETYWDIKNGVGKAEFDVHTGKIKTVGGTYFDSPYGPWKRFQYSISAANEITACSIGTGQTGPFDQVWKKR